MTSLQANDEPIFNNNNKCKYYPPPDQPMPAAQSAYVRN